MQLLIEEMGLCDTVDPLGGSYYVETLTNRMRDEIRSAMADVDARGGIVALIASGAIQAQVSAQAYRHQLDVEAGRFRKVGVNCYRVDEDDPQVELHPYDEADARAQIARLADVRRTRDASAIARALEAVRRAAADGTNTMPAIVDAVKAYASVGEITAALASVLGAYREPVRF
jgi:methylmalonyl-CoA mutase N-terminal domain/subunit